MLTLIFSLAGMRFTARSVSSWWKTSAQGAACKAGSSSPSVWASSLRPTSSWRSVRCKSTAACPFLHSANYCSRGKKIQFWQKYCTDSELFLFGKPVLVLLVHFKIIIYLHTSFFLCLAVFGGFCAKRAWWLWRLLCWAPAPLNGQWREKGSALLDRAGGKREHWEASTIYSLQMPWGLSFFTTDRLLSPGGPSTCLWLWRTAAASACSWTRPPHPLKSARQWLTG